MEDSREEDGETRTCPGCGETKPTSAFSRSKATKHGFQSRCKECKKVEARAGYANNIEHYRTYHREKMASRREAGVPFVDVTCIDCGVTWAKRVDSMKSWQGRCHSCAGTEVLSDPAIREMLAEKARIQIAEWGGRIPNSLRWGIEKPIRGEDHPNWKGGVTAANRLERATAESAAWSKAVKERDKFTCQECDQIGGKLHSHHIKPWADYPDLRLELSNGVTLCKECHQLLHAEEAGRRLGKARDAAAKARRLSSAA